MSLQDAFEQATGRRPDHRAIVKYVREEFIAPGEPLHPNRKRRKLAAKRVRFYRDEYDQDIEAIVDLVFETEKARDQRKKLVSLAKPQNTTRRVIDEVAAVYNRPASHHFPDAGEQQVFNDLARVVAYNEVQKLAHRMTFLCNETLKWFGFSGATGKPRLNVMTPDKFDAIPDPRDPLEPAAFLLDWKGPRPLGELVDDSNVPAYLLYDDTFVYRINAAGFLVGGPQLHGFRKLDGSPRLPGYLQHRALPQEQLLDSGPGLDILSCHEVIVLVNLLILRLSKAQGENQPILRGNLAAVAKGQSFDGETPIALPADVVAEMLQSKTDPEHYLKVAKHFIGAVAQTYGMSYEQFTFQETADTASGKAYEVRRAKLTELRDEQLERAKHDERGTAELVADVLASAGEPTFDPMAMHNDFADPRIPQDAMEELQVLEKGIELGVDNVVDFLRRKNSDLSEEDAAQKVEDNVRIRGVMISALKRLNAPAKPGADPGDTPEENGRKRLGAGDQGDAEPAADAG